MIGPPKQIRNATRSKLVMVVDDDPLVLDVTTVILTQSGFHVLPCQDPHAAIELFGTRAREIDAVLLDLGMPGLNGVDVVRAMERIKADVPVIIFSGLEEETALVSAPNVIGFLQKPFRPHELVNAFCSLLEGKTSNGLS